MKKTPARQLTAARSTVRHAARGQPPQTWCGVVALLFVAGFALAQDPLHPLKPTDRSSPRATLKALLDAGDAAGTLLVRDYMPSPSRAEFHQLHALAADLVSCLELSEVPPAARVKTGRSAALALYETLSRIQLPPWNEIPGTDSWNEASDTNAVWTVPYTEMALVRVRNESGRTEFVFSADTVARAGDFYQRVRGLPYTRPVPLEHMKEIVAIGGGWMIPHHWIAAMPAWVQAPLAGQAAWKWIALSLMFLLVALLLRLAYRLSKRCNRQHPFVQALAQLALPAFLLMATPALAYLALVQLNLSGKVGSAIELTKTAVIFLVGAWILWRTAPVVAEAIIASPRIAPESIDAHLIRICTRLLGIVGGVGLVVVGADRLGLPLYGIIAGVGVGGLAIALAAQPTIENLIGGLSLFADKPIRVGDLCRYGNDMGTVEAIGIRSTRIRGMDRTLTTIPNAFLSRMPVVNSALRDRMLVQSVIGVRHETSPQQLRDLLSTIQQTLLDHPRAVPASVRVRFVGIGASSLDIEVVAYVSTRDWAEFLAIREELYLRILDLIEQSGTGLAFPSQTLYLTHDKGLEPRRAEPVEPPARQGLNA